MDKEKDDNNQPTDSLKLVLDKLEEYEKKITDYESKLKEVTDFNKELLSRKVETPKTEDAVDLLSKYLKEDN